MSEFSPYGRNSGYKWKLSNKLPKILYPAHKHFPKEGPRGFKTIKTTGPQNKLRTTEGANKMYIHFKKGKNCIKI